MRTWLLAFVILWVPAVVHAEPRLTTFDRPHVAVEGQAGLGTPVGLAGLSVIVAPHERLSFELGAGLGATGTQRAAMVRVRALGYASMVSLSLGAGLSEGEYSWYYGGLLTSTYKHWERARWGSGEVSIAINVRSLQIRMFGGYSRQLDPGWGCEDRDDRETDIPPGLCTGTGGHRLVYTGAALRFATPL